MQAAHFVPVGRFSLMGAKNDRHKEGKYHAAAG
jgi:hypothetical protein